MSNPPSGQSSLPQLPKEELSFDAQSLIQSIDARLDSSEWQFAGERETSEQGKLLLAAAMRHSARLLQELDAADTNELTFAARLLARTLYETLTLTTYLSFFEQTGYDQVRSNYKAHVNETIAAVKRVNDQIAADAQQSGREDVSPPVPTASLESLLSNLGESNAKLEFGEMVRRISEADSQGYFRENLRRVRLIYSATSLFAPHTNYWVLKGYFYAETKGALTPTLRMFSGNVTSSGDRLFTMHMTACVAVLVLQDVGHPMEEAHRIIDKYEPMVGSTDGPGS